MRDALRQSVGMQGLALSNHDLAGFAATALDVHARGEVGFLYADAVQCVLLGLCLGSGTYTLD